MASEARKRVEKAALARVKKNAAKAGQALRDAVIVKLTRGQPRRVSQGRPTGLDPSAPGEPPKIVTGRLRLAQTYEVEERPREVVIRVGSNVEYARHLELGTRLMAARPFLRPALKENARAIGKILADDPE